MNKSVLSLLEAKELIEELNHQYVEAIDDDELEKWPEFFTDDALYQIISRENYDRNFPQAVIYCDSKGMLKDRITAHRHANIYEPHFYRHLISNIRIVGEENGVFTVRSNYAVFQTKLDGETKIFNTGRYFDEVVFEDSQPKFKKRTVVFDTLSIPTLLVTPI
ncbi:aromatic-ring-hydroxylating dioxygenase subunit beta [Halalkalibacterium ligniniphilum]|uniref:aromatic-ring-hydroxylating dioxygenase subunit beta n=1 Tax=Halalkalibacterium ligniniphilum TaxID=1134413 RepID=UPI00034711C4|nr:aromatic-ring-hydroxylating dioxygenase subunit beta [Halalkalibacterium ligniniphilum]